MRGKTSSLLEGLKPEIQRSSVHVEKLRMKFVSSRGQARHQRLVQKMGEMRLWEERELNRRGVDLEQRARLRMWPAVLVLKLPAR